MVSKRSPEHVIMNSRIDETSAPERKHTLEALQRSADAHQLDADIDGHKRVEALLAGENHLLEMVAKGESLPSILDGICRLVEEISSGSLCSILLLDPKNNMLGLGAAPTFPASYTSAFGGKATGPGRGRCGGPGSRAMPKHVVIRIQ